ncbi:MAG: PspC domain-containing protein [Eubacteriales bacterium]|nr:PspC domain-containing protein [Eubacteriales bacterium]
MRRLTKSRNQMVCGVCAGVAEYLNIDVTIVRLIWAGVMCFAGTGLLAYIIAAIVMPEPDQITM